MSISFSNCGTDTKPSNVLRRYLRFLPIISFPGFLWVLRVAEHWPPHIVLQHHAVWLRIFDGNGHIFFYRLGIYNFLGIQLYFSCICFLLLYRTHMEAAAIFAPVNLKPLLKSLTKCDNGRYRALVCFVSYFITDHFSCIIIPSTFFISRFFLRYSLVRYPFTSSTTFAPVNVSM